MTLAEHVRAIVDALPPEGAVTLPAATLREWLVNDKPLVIEPVVESQSWRERLWTVPPETRLGVREVAEAVDRSRDWVYRAVSGKGATKAGRDRLPCQKLDGELVFTAGAVRTWIQRSELIVNPPAPLLRRA
jgi:hypothetical protein